MTAQDLLKLEPWRFRFLGDEVGFATPGFLAFAVVAVLVAVIGVVLALTRPSRVRRVLPERFAEKLAPGVSVVRPAAQSALYGVGLMLFALALGQPECNGKKEPVKRSGLDVVVAIDASNSMLARDVQPSRIQRAKLEILTLLEELEGDRIGIVVFAGSAFIQCPLTTDYDAARLFLDSVDPKDMPQGGTDIGGALLLSKQVLDNGGGEGRDRVVVLLTDGEDFGGDVDAALSELKKGNVRVFAVGIGSETGEPIPIIGRTGEVAGYKRDDTGQTVLTRLNSSALRRIADSTGGEYFHEPRSVAMGEVVERIDRLQRAELEATTTVRYEQVYQYYALPGFVLVVLGMLVRPSRRRPPR